MVRALFDVLFVLALVVPVLAVLAGGIMLLMPEPTKRTVAMRRRLRTHA